MAFSNLKQSISIIRQSKSINENTVHFDLDFDPCSLNKHLTLIRVSILISTNSVPRKYNTIIIGDFFFFNMKSKQA